MSASLGCDEGDDNPPGGGNPPGGDNPPDDTPLPELWVSQGRLSGSARADWLYILPEACSIGDACVDASGWRRVIRFSTEIQNRGDAPLLLGAAGSGDGFVAPDPCRNRPFVTVAPEQSLFDSQGNLVLTTRSRPFCWADTTRLADMDGPETAGHPVSHQTCVENQGISPGWASIQASNRDCQLLDVTELPAGEYRLRVTVDPDGRLQQKSLEGQSAEVTVRLTPREEHEVCVGEGDCHVPVLGACEGVTCRVAAEPVAYCEEDVAIVVMGPGLCHPVDGTCIEERSETRCLALDRICLDGECVDPCLGLGCSMPDDYCDGNVAVVHGGDLCDRETGTCLQPETTRVDCEEDLDVCREGRCVDLCLGVDCSGTRTYCEGETVVQEGPGQCDWTSGECVGGEREVLECEEGESCVDGECR